MQQESFYGKGFSFPIKPDLKGALTFLEGEEKIRQSIWLILSTAPDERQMRQTFGCGIYDLVFQPNTAATRAHIQENVREALVRWEPRIDVLDVRAETAPGSNNYLLIRIDYRLRTNNALFNLVYPFFLQEGTS